MTDSMERGYAIVIVDGALKVIASTAQRAFTVRIVRNAQLTVGMESVQAALMAQENASARRGGSWKHECHAQHVHLAISVPIVNYAPVLLKVVYRVVAMANAHSLEVKQCVIAMHDIVG